MLQIYQQFYRDLGVRRFNELLSPRLNLFKGFPRKSIYHHFTQDEEMFPDADKPYFQGYSKRLPLDLIFRSNMMEGAPRELPFTPQRFTLPFIKKHNLFKYTPDAASAPIDDRTLVVVNYNPLKFAYRYLLTPVSEYQKWESFQKTFWKNISDTAIKTSKQQFVIMEPFTTIPSFNMLMNFGDKEGMGLARLFNNHDRRFILHLANFIDDDRRERSVLNTVAIEAMDKINIVFMLKDGRCSVLNLAYLYSWIKGDEGVSTVKVSFKRDHRIVTKSLLKYFLVLSSAIPEDAVDEQVQALPNKEDDIEHDDEDEESYTSNPGLVSFSAQTKTQTLSQPLVKPNEVEELSTDMVKSLDDDLAILEEQTRHELTKQGISIKDGQVTDLVPVKKTFTSKEVYDEIHTSLSPNAVLRKKLAAALEDDTLNAASYKKALADSEKYTKMNDPYGSGKALSERIVIDPESTKLSEEKSKLVTNKTVLDTSMGNSTLQDYTRGYVNNHHRNDILKAVGALQKGGVIIQKHEIVLEHTVMGAVEIHNVELKPINGVASSLWFKLPVVEDDGTFKVGGNKYQMRKQRVDLPIRKISSTEVSLNSYYGKAFVSSENKVANSSSAWILRQLESASFNGSEWITDVVPGDTFENDRKTPYIYSVLATRFRSFKAGDIMFHFDKYTIEGAHSELAKARMDKGMTLCGVSGRGLVYIDLDDHFYVEQNNVLTDIGDVYDVLQLDPHDSPIRFSELALFRKNVPVGIVLGYKLGWSKLLSLLEVTPRFVEPRKRLNLAPDEYPIPFADGVCVFSRKDRFATMILAGFMDYSKSTRMLSLSNFENQDVYLNLLSSKGLGAIYIREIDMLFDYFVDPITEEILQDMKEPTTFEGLLLRSTQLLMSYNHPKPYDGAFTRIRGYERFSGAVYREMSAAIRQFRSKNIAGRSRIDISPYKVWQSINEDPTKMMVADINPYQEMKNDEGVTYVGEGGRSADGMNKASRSFHVNDVGVVSEGTVDSADVGVNIYTSSDPAIKNYRGLKQNGKEITSTNRHCSAVLLAPSATHDD